MEFIEIKSQADMGIWIVYFLYGETSYKILNT